MKLREIDNSCSVTKCGLNVKGACYREACPHRRQGYPSQRHIQDALIVVCALFGGAALILLTHLLR